MKWAILGCGYVGTRLARALVANGHAVTVTSRTDDGCASLGKALPTTSVLRYSMGDEIESSSQYDVLVISAPPGGIPAPERAVAQQLLPHQRLLYLSTTGVYAPGLGADVEDGFALSPGSERSMRRLRVEEALAVAHENTVVLRIPGIYGPGRGVHARLLAGTYRLIGESTTLVSRIYVDDLVEGIDLLGTRQTLEHRAFVIGDELPTTASEHAIGVAERLGLPAPAIVDPSTVSAAVRAMLGADRRIIPKRLHELGWRAKHPSWREGLKAALAEAGLG